MMRLDAATVLLQWATGGLVFLWITSRRREVGLGYGWLLRGTFGLLALAAVAVGQVTFPSVGRDLSALATALAAFAALGVSVARRRAGVAAQRGHQARASARVAAMTGIERTAQRFDTSVPEFPPALDLVAPALGAIGCLLSAVGTGGPVALAALRFLVGAAFLGAITDAMLLGHWYLVQPGLGRGPLIELVRWTALVWPFEVIVMLLPTGMVSVINGTIDDGWNGVLGWMWLVCAVTTIGLCGVTRAALKERQYSAVMAATGLLYLAILTAFGTDLVARAVLAS
jgi:hypothetical protein